VVLCLPQNLTKLKRAVREGVEMTPLRMVLTLLSSISNLQQSSCAHAYPLTRRWPRCPTSKLGARFYSRKSQDS